MKVSLHAPWLIAEFDAPCRVLSWTLNRPGFVTAHRVVFREVRNRDLPESLDAARWLHTELKRMGLDDAPALLTSRSIDSYRLHTAHAGRVEATCLVTAGLSNAERIGHRQTPDPKRFGTINIAVHCTDGLTEAAQIEALTLVAQARTAAVMDSSHLLPEGLATGTGTDCIALATRPGDTGFAGLHTAVGEAIGRATYDAVAEACADWLATRPDLNGGTSP